jgi:site-specific DNA recombinase
VDWGAKMYVHRVNNSKRIPHFTCSAYSKTLVGTLCGTQHRVEAYVVMTLIRETLNEITKFSKEDKAEFERIVQKAILAQHSTDVKAQEVMLLACKKHLEELETLIC